MLTLLGILAAVAVPRYAGLQIQARMRALQHLAAQMRSAANMGHGLWVATGNVSPVIVDGQSVAIVNGYPDGAGIRSLTEADGFKASISETAVTYAPKGARAPAGCNLTYSGAATVGSSFTIKYAGATELSDAALQKSC